MENGFKRWGSEWGRIRLGEDWYKSGMGWLRIGMGLDLRG